MSSAEDDPWQRGADPPGTIAGDDEQHWRDSLIAAGPPGAGQPRQPRPPALPIYTIAELRAEVAKAGPRRFLFRGLWPAGDYGVLAATRKAQKTMTCCDAAVAAASGTPFLGIFPVDTTGPVIMFVGEGGRANTLRRLDAVADEHSVTLDDLPLHVVPRAPHLRNLEHVAQIDAHVRTVKPVLVTLDPLYLSAGGAQGADLYAMGELLERAQLAITEYGAALLVAHHWNRKQGSGADRISGAGPAEWGRVLISVEEKSRKVEDEQQASIVTTAWSVIGGEIPDLAVTVTRRIWADDPDDLDSPMHVQTSAQLGTPSAAAERAATKMSPSQTKVYGALVAANGIPLSVRDIGDRIVSMFGEDNALRRNTISDALNALSEQGRVDVLDPSGPGGKSTAKLWLVMGSSSPDPELFP